MLRPKNPAQPYRIVGATRCVAHCGASPTPRGASPPKIPPDHIVGDAAMLRPREATKHPASATPQQLMMAGPSFGLGQTAAPRKRGDSLPVYGEGWGGAGREAAQLIHTHLPSCCFPGTPVDGGAIIWPGANSGAQEAEDTPSPFTLALPISAWGIAEHAVHQLPGCRDVSEAAKS
jgi:hypothetical protein